MQILSYTNWRLITDDLSYLILGVISSFVSWLIIVLAWIYILVSNNQFSLFFKEQGNHTYPKKRLGFMISVWAVLSGQYHLFKTIDTAI